MKFLLKILLNVLKIFVAGYIRGIKEMGIFVILFVMMIFYGSITFILSRATVVPEIGADGLIILFFSLLWPIVFAINAD